MHYNKKQESEKRIMQIGNVAVTKKVRLMKKFFGFSVALIGLSLIPAHAQNTTEDTGMNVKVLLNTDAFFGFNPAFYGTKSMSDSIDLTFYGIFWSAGTGGPGTQGWGNWTEFGLGAGFKLSDELYFNPALGVLSGSLLSNLGKPRLGEGIVPNFTLTLNNAQWEGEIYLGYYLGLQKTGGLTNNYLHYWANAGYKFSGFFSSGLHWEHLRFLGGTGRPSGVAYDFYQSVGPYVQFSNPKRTTFVRFTGGYDLRSDAEQTKSGYALDTFWKMTLGFNF